ncbi:MAG: V-type ATP synthase subunit E [Eubacterium sp.]|nr:V-type ATP synthase subunit E [Eubacterium sp.]
MAGLDKIIDEIISEANGEAQSITDAARKEADEIMRVAKAEADEIAGDITKKAQNEQKTIDERAKSSADMQKRQAALKAKQEAISQVIDEAYDKVIGYDIDTYFSMVEKMLKANVQAKDGVVYLNDKDKGRMPAGFPQKIAQIATEAGGSLKLSEETKAIDGGFILVYGGIEQNCSIRAMFNEKHDDLVDAVNSVIFEEQAAV